MPDPRFFETLAPISVEDAVSFAGAKLVAGADTGVIARVANHEEDDLDGAVVYCSTPDLLATLSSKTFGLCLTTQDLASDAPQGGAVAVAKSPRLSFALVARRLHRSIKLTARAKGASLSATVDETAIVGEGATLGDDVRLGPHVYIGPGVVVGDGCQIEAGASITHALLGKNLRILAGARIGQAGFGFVESDDGLVRVPQLGRVVIEDDVEIGANAAIDRGALGDTMIGRGTKIDNLVQIGHNVRIGRYCILAAQTGVSGSCVIGDGVFMGGQVGLSDHLTIGAGAQIAAGSGLMRDVPAGEKWGGRPAKPVKDWLKETATLAKLAKKKNG